VAANHAGEQLERLTTPPAWHAQVWRLSWPVILANVTIPLVGLVDVYVMGRLPDPAYIAAVAMGAAMFSAVYWLFGFLRMGTTGMTAQSYGAKALTEIDAIFKRALVIAVLLGSTIILLQWPLKAVLFMLFEPGANVAALAEAYYDIRIFGAPGLLIHLVELGILFGLQRMTYTLWLSIGLNLTNLILDYFFVLGLDMGVAGVALGTIISEWGAAFFGFWLVRAAYRDLGAPSVRVNLLEREALRRFFTISSNLILRTFFVQLPFFTGTVLATQIGDLTLAVHGVLMQLFFMMTYSLDAFAHTAETLSGYFYGAKNPKGVRKATLYSSIWGFGFALLTGLLYLGTATHIVAQLTRANEIITLAAEYLPWLAISPLFCVWAFLLDGIFIGTTHIIQMRNAMVLSALCWGVMLLITFESWQYHAIWASLNVFMIARAVILGLHYPQIEQGAAG